MFSAYITNLQPDPKRAWRLGWGHSGDLEQALPKEEDQARVVRRPELAVDRETEDVAVEAAAAFRVGRAQEYSAAQHVHGLITSRHG